MRAYRMRARYPRYKIICSGYGGDIMKMQWGTVSAGGCIYPVKHPSSMAAMGNNGLENGSGTSSYMLEPSMGRRGKGN
ncbi:hypothetical protein I7I48_02874 [Histoplasma ohiense]|nr:hypothetical protein I7I48_02874 [Histoplasma ohiense (nom. inval.)]